MSATFLEGLAFGRAAERGDAAIAARAAGVPAARLAHDFGPNAADQAALVRRLFDPRPSPRPDPEFRRLLEASLLEAVDARPAPNRCPAAVPARATAGASRSARPAGFLRPLLLGASSLALGALLFLRPMDISSELAPPPTALAATAVPPGGPTGTFTPQARATKDTRHAQQVASGSTAGS